MFTNYRYYTNGKTVYAVSTYAGRKVRGKAQCASEDEFDLEKGKKLAAARCGAKIAGKRLKRAENKFLKAVEEQYRIQKHVDKMTEYLFDARNAERLAKNYEREILEEM